MSRQDEARLSDISEAITAIREYLSRGNLHDGMVYDAVRVRLIEVGEAVKGIDPDLLDSAPGVPWKEIARMRDHLAHRYFDTDHAIVQDVLDNDIGPLAEAVQSLIGLVERRERDAHAATEPTPLEQLRKNLAEREARDPEKDQDHGNEP